MKIERTKNATKNIFFGTMLKLYQIIVPFLMRTAMIYFMGVQYLGLNSLFTSVLQVLNLAELGVGSAMIFSMYKPIAEDDPKTICALMRLYKLYYRIIGLVILIVGMIICPFVPYLIKSDLPVGMNVYVLYLLNLMATVFSYWLFAYKNSILQAHQRNDITSKVSIAVNTIQYILQLLAICIMKNYYAYVLISLLGQICINVCTAFVSNKLYPDYKPEGEIDKKSIKEINKRVKDLFTAKIGGVVINSADTIVISAFLGLTMLAIYQNYYYILTAIIGIISVVFSSCTAGIGNSIIVETEEKNYNDLRKFTFMIAWLAGMCTCCFLNLFQPFITLWVGKDLLLSFPCVICLCIYFYVYEINTLLNTYKDAAGIWHKDRFRPLITAMSNLILNLILVNYIGIYGILISTFATFLLIGMPWLLHNLFTDVFVGINPKDYIIMLFKYTVTVIIISFVTYFVCSYIQGYSLLSILTRGIICVVVFVSIWVILYRNTKEMKESIELANKILKRRET